MLKYIIKATFILTLSLTASVFFLSEAKADTNTEIKVEPLHIIAQSSNEVGTFPFQGDFAQEGRNPALPTFEKSFYEAATRNIDDKELIMRHSIVSKALGFVGNSYTWGGNDPNEGTDCSGFTLYIMDKVAGVSLPHSSIAQAGKGREIEEAHLKPGDLVFYDKGGRINHVGIYIGDNKIVHASSEKNGIMVSDLYNNRKPVKFVSIL